eukprot:TRINITY_DN113735_c0_g1_i1.p1 TRINITY_DN113735_c0_g1~~TRINITY_DN113735_c0_g1_i1.p1  ORF type:complete len:128 (-),score=25.75 TRINITY_DN113735_c0_g1_i1:266-607(-)
MAEGAIIQETAFIQHHLVIGKNLLAAGTVALVLPAWLRYLVPQAKKHYKEHEVIMAFEKVHEQHKGEVHQPALVKHVGQCISKMSPETLQTVFENIEKRLKNIKEGKQKRASA